MHRKVSELRRILGQVAKGEVKQVTTGGRVITLCCPVWASDKRCDLKIVGKPCEGKPHARFDEGRLGKSMDCTSLLLYRIISFSKVIKVIKDKEVI